MMTDNFQDLNCFFLAIFRKLQENTYFPEHSGISLILLIERGTPGECSKKNYKKTTR